MTPAVCFLTLGLDHPLWSAFWLGGCAIAPGVPLTWWGGVRQLCFCYKFPAMLCNSGEYCCLSFANWVVFLHTWTFLLVICLLPCVLAGLAVVCRAHPSSLAPQSLLHCNIPPQMFAEHSDQRWMLKWAGAHLSPPKSAFLVWAMARFPQADS